MKNNTNMGSLRSCLFLLVMFVQLQHIIGKPFFTDMLCDYYCDDDDDVSTTTSSSDEDDYGDFFGLCSCGTRRPPRLRPGANIPPNINMRLPPSANGMRFNISNNNGQWSLDVGPNGPNLTGGVTNGGALTGVPVTGGLPIGAPPGGIPIGGPPNGIPPGVPTTSPITAGVATTASATAAPTTAKK